MLGDPEPRLGLADGRLGLLLAGADLRVVEHGDDLSGRDLVALPHGDLADPPGRLGPDRGVVPLDSSAHGNHAGRHGGPGQEEAPPRDRHQAQDEERSGEDDRPAPAASRRGRDRRRRGFGRGHARRVLGAWRARSGQPRTRRMLCPLESRRAGGEPVRDHLLEVIDVGRGRGRLEPERPSAREHALPEAGRREEEHQAADDAQMGQHRIDRAKRPLADAALHDALHGAEHPRRLGQHRELEVLSPGQDLAQHHRAEVRRAPRRRVPDDGDEVAEQVRRRPRRVGERLHAGHDLGEGGAHDRHVQVPLAAEVIVDHRLVDLGLRGDGRDGDAVVSALGEESRARRR